MWIYCANMCITAINRSKKCAKRQADSESALPSNSISIGYSRFLGKKTTAKVIHILLKTAFFRVRRRLLVFGNG